MKLLKFLTCILLSAGPLAVLGQHRSSPDTLLDHIRGKWLLKGTIAGAKIEHDITAAWVLGHQYIELKETSREKKADGMPPYDAIVFITFNKGTNLYDCLWLDNTSNSGLSNGIIAHAGVESNRLALLFKFSDKSLFHTCLTYNAATHSWHWQMISDENGKTSVFADAEMSNNDLHTQK